MEDRGDESGPLVCMKDDVEIDGDDPRCKHPTSKCRFRESCLVTEAVRAGRKRENALGQEAAGAMSVECDVAVIGAGPAGLTAGMYLARAGLRAVILEKLAPGGQAAMTDVVENYPGFDGPVGGFDLTEAMRRQAERSGAEVRTGEATGIDGGPGEGGKVVRLADGDLRCRAVIIATGARHSRLGIPGEDRFWGKGISTCATCDGMFYRGKRVVVIGGGDTAIKETVFLTKFAEKITVVHRRDRLRAAKVLRDRIFSFGGQVEFAWNAAAVEILGGEQDGHDRVRGVRLRDVKTGEERVLDCDGVFMFVGLTPNTELVKGVVDLDEKGYIVTDEMMATSVQGIYAAGDCRRRPLRQIVTACGEGAVAAHAAEEFLEE